MHAGRDRRRAERPPSRLATGQQPSSYNLTQAHLNDTLRVVREITRQQPMNACTSPKAPEIEVCHRCPTRGLRGLPSDFTKQTPPARSPTHDEHVASRELGLRIIVTRAGPRARGYMSCMNAQHAVPGSDLDTLVTLHKTSEPITRADIPRPQRLRLMMAPASVPLYSRILHSLASVSA